MMKLFYEINGHKMEDVKLNDIIVVFNRDGSIHEQALINYDGEGIEEKLINAEKECDEIVCVVLLPFGEQIFV